MGKRRRERQSGPTPELEAQIEKAKAASVGQLLFKCARLLNEHALARIEIPESSREGPAERGRDRDAPLRIRPAHTSLFPHIDLAGTRSTELARRMGISKQAVGQLIDELELLEVLERVPDPEDGRAKLVRFCQTPGRSLLDGLAHLRAIEQELAQQIGPARMAALHEGLTALLAVLEAAHAEPRANEISKPPSRGPRAGS